MDGYSLQIFFYGAFWVCLSKIHLQNISLIVSTAEEESKDKQKISMSELVYHV